MNTSFEFSTLLIAISEKLTNISIEFSTLLIAIFTIALASFSLWQTVITRDSARRQVRAYIGVKNGSVTLFNNNTTAVADIEFTNTGQSPAYEFSTWLKIKIDAPDASPFGEELSVAERTGSSILLPGESVHCRVPLDISPGELPELGAGATSLFVGVAPTTGMRSKRRDTSNSEPQPQSIRGTFGRFAPTRSAMSRTDHHHHPHNVQPRDRRADRQTP